jgi:hypothetical protein
MTLTSMERAILELVVEDSFALSELVSRVRTEQPSLSLAAARRVARDVTKALLQRGLVQVTAKPSAYELEHDIDAVAGLKELESDLAWLEARHAKPHVRVVATAQGEAAYNAR